LGHNWSRSRTALGRHMVISTSVRWAHMGLQESISSRSKGGLMPRILRLCIVDGSDEIDRTKTAQ
jgi:hypothetical protein